MKHIALCLTSALAGFLLVLALLTKYEYINPYTLEIRSIVSIGKIELFETSWSMGGTPLAGTRKRIRNDETSTWIPLGRNKLINMSTRTFKGGEYYQSLESLLNYYFSDYKNDLIAIHEEFIDRLRSGETPTQAEVLILEKRKSAHGSLSNREIHYPYRVSDERMLEIDSRAKRIHIGMHQGDVIKILGQPDEVNQTLDKNNWKKKIGHSFVSIKQRDQKTGSVVQKNENLVRIQFDLEGQVKRVDFVRRN